MQSGNVFNENGRKSSASSSSSSSSNALPGDANTHIPSPTATTSLMEDQSKFVHDQKPTITFSKRNDSKDKIGSRSLKSLATPKSATRKILPKSVTPKSAATPKSVASGPTANVYAAGEGGTRSVWDEFATADIRASAPVRQTNFGEV